MSVDRAIAAFVMASGARDAALARAEAARHACTLANDEMRAAGGEEAAAKEAFIVAANVLARALGGQSDE